VYSTSPFSRDLSNRNIEGRASSPVSNRATGIIMSKLTLGGAQGPTIASAPDQALNES
jgi:hypothetical protein